MKNTAHINNNEIIESNPNAGSSTTITDTNKLMILKDYINGIKKAKLTIVPTDLYTSNGVKKIDWSNGDILQVNQIIRVLNKEGTGYLKDSQNRDILFRITGRKIKYEGQIFIDLELQEIKRIEVGEYDRVE